MVDEIGHQVHAKHHCTKECNDEHGNLDQKIDHDFSLVEAPKLATHRALHVIALCISGLVHMLAFLVTLDTGLAPAIDVLSVLVTTPGAGRPLMMIIGSNFLRLPDVSLTAFYCLV